MNFFGLHGKLPWVAASDEWAGPFLFAIFSVLWEASPPLTLKLLYWSMTDNQYTLI